MSKTCIKSTLRAMALNYPKRSHVWDRLDTEAVIEAADTIEELQSKVEHLLLCARTLEGLETEQDAELSALRQKVSSNNELLSKIDEYLELKGVGKSAVIRHLIRNGLADIARSGGNRNG